MPWWSEQGYYFYGTDDNVAANTPMEAFALANPLILLKPDFSSLSIKGQVVWDQEKITSSSVIRKRDFPLYPKPSNLTWYPKEGRAVLTYHIGKYIQRLNEWVLKPVAPEKIVFSISPYNAYDLGLNFFFLALEESSNISAPMLQERAVPTFSIMAFSESGCGKKDGCNRLVTYLPAYQNITANLLPAEAVFYLWRGRPRSYKDEPYLRFIMRLE